MQTWEIAGMNVKAGEKKKEVFQIDNSKAIMPITLINGSHAGKTILITSGVHGGEYVGIKALMELSNELTPENIHGQLILIHPVHFSSFINKLPCSIEDGKNLNRIFPPNKNGTITDKIAWSLWSDFQKFSDFHLDLHGCSDEWLNTHVYYVGVGDEETIAISKKAAMASGVKIMVKSTSTSGAYNHAGVNGIPGILLERGECGYWMQEDVDLYKTDIRNVLRELGTLKSPKEPKQHQPIEATNIIYAHSDFQGCWVPKIKIHQNFIEGDVLGQITDMFGEVLQTIHAKQDGVGLYMLSNLYIEKGGFAIAYAKLI